MDVELNPGEQIDDLQFRGLHIIQDSRAFRFGTDSVILAGFAEARPGETGVDLCSGNAVLPLLASKRTGAHFYAVELQKRAADLARRSVAMNGMEADVEVLEADISEAPSLLKGVKVDLVTVNPPYEKAGSGFESGSEEIRIARHEVACTLEDVLRVASKLLQTGGRFYMVHRASRLAEVISGMTAVRIEPKTVRLVQSEAGKPPFLILVKGVKDARPGCTVPENLIIQYGDGRYTEEMDRIYHKHG